MPTDKDIAPTVPGGKMITCLLPNDGVDGAVMKALHREKGILTANTFQCRGIYGPDIKTGLQRMMPHPVAVKMLTVVVPDDQAEALFAFIYEKARIDRPDGGIIYMGAIDGATAFTLPEGIADEPGGKG